MMNGQTQGWLAQSRRLLREIAPNRLDSQPTIRRGGVISEFMDRVKTVLALGAHPDDLELGCGATLAKLSARGVAVHAVIFSDGKQGGSPGFDRTAESRAALQALGAASVTQHDFRDTCLHEALNDLIACTEDHASKLAPDRVYTMFHLDRHQDH